MMMKFSPTASRTRRTISTGSACGSRTKLPQLVLTLVGLRGDELVDEIALGAHDLDAVVPGPLCELGGAGVVVDGPLDLGVGERVRREGADRALQGARG